MHGIEIIQRPQVVVTVFIKLLFIYKVVEVFQLLVIAMFGPVLLISISTEENKKS